MLAVLSFSLPRYLDCQYVTDSSGSGKTSLLNLMSGLLKPTKGEIFFEDYKYSLLLEEEIDKIRATNFGFIFQKLHLILH